MSTTTQASQRIGALLDENSFVEIGAQITARATDFNLKQKRCDAFHFFFYILKFTIILCCFIIFNLL